MWEFEQLLRYKAFYEVKGLRHDLGDPRVLSNNVQKEQEHMWSMGWGSEQFLTYKAFLEVKGIGRDPRSVSLNVSYHKEQEYI